MYLLNHNILSHSDSTYSTFLGIYSTKTFLLTPDTPWFLLMHILSTRPRPNTPIPCAHSPMLCGNCSGATSTMHIMDIVIQTDRRRVMTHQKKKSFIAKMTGGPRGMGRVSKNPVDHENVTRNYIRIFCILGDAANHPSSGVKA